MKLCSEIHAPAILSRGISLRRLLDREQYRRCRVEKNLLLLPRIEPRPSNPYPVILPFVLSRLISKYTAHILNRS
jgi:hypothetical protein